MTSGEQRVANPAARGWRRGAILWWWVGGVALAATILAASVDWYVAEPSDALAKATYVGRASCSGCHQAEHADFLGSDHDRAMELATDETVLGDFKDAGFERLGVTTRMFRRGGKFVVNAEGPDGEQHDYEVKYTFGVDPLQQYLTEFPDGRLQVLPVSWDVHRREWFHVPPPDAPDQRILPGDPTHWTGIGQNWNTTCAECHSTDLQKHYDVKTDTYHTTFAEIDVSCEACHGPGNLHVKLASARSLFWDRRHGYGLARLKGVSNTPEIEACAKCHSQRSEVHADFRPGERFEDYYDPSLLYQGLYHADGQILDEVYVYGSFLQSRMHREGVRCSDCHNPHSLQLKFDGNALCAQCHVPAKYDTPAHHHHEVNTPGASCVECHMPARNYMVVDPRRDHSIRVPRPDLTVAVGTPNACNVCHVKEGESAEWAAKKVIEWYGPNRAGQPAWAEAIAGGRAAAPEAELLLLEVVQRLHAPAIVKATALELLGQYNSPAVTDTISAALSHGDPLVRQAALHSLPAASLQQYVELAAPLLDDPVRTVRIAAALALLPVDAGALDADQKIALDAATGEYRQQLLLSAERGGSHIQLAQLARRAGDVDQAIAELRTAIRLAPYLSGARSQLAQVLYEHLGPNEEVDQLRRKEIELLERDAEMLPENAEIPYNLGRLLYQVDKLDEAEQRFAGAHQLAPRSYQYALALALLQKEQYERGDDGAFDKTIESLRTLNDLDPNNPDAKNLLREVLQLREERKEK